MNTFTKKETLTVGLAIFAMFFGAGNIIFPIAIGQYSLNQCPYALIGFLVTAVVMPFAGLFAMMRFRGQIHHFFGCFGRAPGLLMAGLIIALLGPFGAAPRCLALAYSTLSLSIPGISIFLFSSICCLLIFCVAYRKNNLMKWLGLVFSPFKIGLLVWIIVKGLMDLPESEIANTTSPPTLLWYGLTEGYKTMDLLAAFFFAPIVISSIPRAENEKEMNRFFLKASLIGAFLLTAIYAGFCYLAYFFAETLADVPPEKLLGAIAIQVLGKHAAIIMGLTVTLACISTAIALIAAFANFIANEVLQGKIPHKWILSATLLLTFAITSLNFQGIAQFLNPVLSFCYPLLIVLTIYNLIRSPKGNVYDHI